MNRKMPFIKKGAVIFAALFYFIYFSGYTSSALEGKVAAVNIHYERGVRFYKQGEYDKAVKELKRVLELDPLNTNAQKYLTEATNRKNKKTVEELYKEADTYYKQKEYQKALDVYTKALDVIPGDGYTVYKIELLRAKIEKLDAIKQNTQYKAKQREKELERVAKKKEERARLLKKKVAIELVREEQKEQKKKTKEMVEEGIEKKIKEEDKAEVRNIALEKETVLRQEKGPEAQPSKPATAAKDEKKVASLSKKTSDQEKLYKIKFLYELGKKYYNEGDYRRAIESFQQVIDLEGNPRILYTPYAKKYIDRAKEKLDEQVRRDKVREIEDVESDMIYKVIEAAKVSAEPIAGTKIKNVNIQTPEIISSIHKKLQTPVEMDFQNVDVVYVLDYLSEKTGANIVMSSAVTKGKRSVSVKIKGMPLEEALMYVLKSAGLTYRIDKNVIWIATPEEIANEQMETKVFTLKKGKGAFTEFKTLTTGSVGLGSASDVDKVTTVKDIIEKAITWPAGSKIVLDERIGSLIVTNTPYNLEIIEKILDKIDAEPVQVLIETRFLEVTVTDLSELGIDWQLNANLAFDQSGRGMVQGIASNSGIAFTDTARNSEGFNLTYQGLLTKPQFQLVIHALEENKKTKTLSAPRVTTLDNQMATMKVVDEWIYPTRYEFQIVQNDSNGDGDFNDAGETQYKNVPSDFVKRDVGILLRVTPSVGTDEDIITLTLIPEVSDAVADFFTFTGGVTLPKFSSRNLSTSVVVNNGDTVVLGGLIKETRSKTRTRVPVLGDMPWIGKFFRKETDNIERKNLLIFVTATILSSKGEKVVLNRK